MLLLQPPDMLYEFSKIVCEFPHTHNSTRQLQLLQARINSYMDKQSLMAFYPEIHWRIDAEDYMAKNSSSFNLIEYRLNDAEIEGFEQWLAREKISMPAMLNYCAEKRIKVSFTYSEKSENWCISLTGQNENRFNSGATLTTWSDDALEAFYMAVYKATVIFDDGQWKTRKSSNRG